jgi:hypothetical protein
MSAMVAPMMAQKSREATIASVQVAARMVIARRGSATTRQR